MAIALGGQTALSFGVTNAAGVATSPTTAQIVIIQPDGSTATPTPALTLAAGGLTLPSAGTVLGYFTPTMTGWHQWVGSSTGPATATFPDSFTVIGTGLNSTYAPIVSLSEVRGHLRMTDTSNDGYLQRFALTASEICESYKGTGKVWRRTGRTETFDGRNTFALNLQRRPILSITSVVESGVTLNPTTDFCYDAANAILYRGSTTAYGPPWLDGQQNIVVTYVAGTNGAIPEGVRQGCLELVKHLWDTQRGGSQLPRQGGSDDTWDPRMGYTIPRRVKELWAPFKAHM